MNHISSDGKRKVNQINEKVKDLTRHIENHANIPSINDSAEPSNIEKKAKDCDKVMGLIKEKIQTSDKRTIVQLLTLAPPSWSISEVKTNFSY